MKKIIFVLSIAVFVLLACKDETPPRFYYYGDASANKNGVEWEAKPFATRNKDGKIVLKFDVHSKEGFLRQEIRAGFIDFDVRRYTQLVDGMQDSLFTVSYIVLGSDGDVLIDHFYYEPDQENFFSIEKIDTKKKTVKGSFRLKFNNKKGEIISFTNGTFDTKITMDLLE